MHAALYSHGRRRPEIARHLGITPRSVKRALERIMAVSRDELVRLAGTAVGRASAGGRLAFGLAGPRETREAQLHLATCPRCGALYERLDLWREKVAALLPVPALEQAQPGLIERARMAAAERLSGWAAAMAVTVRARCASTPSSWGRPAQAARPTRAWPTRPRWLVCAPARPRPIAGCLAIGGGATYCVQRGVDPIGGLTAVVAPAHRETRSDAAPQAGSSRATPNAPSRHRDGAGANADADAARPAPPPTRQAATQPTAQPEPSPVQQRNTSR